MTKSARVHAWLADNGPATVATIAGALGMNHEYVRNALYPYPERFVIVATVKSRGPRACLWHVKPPRDKHRRRCQPVTLPDGRTVQAHYSAVNHVWLLADSVTVVWPVGKNEGDKNGRI